MKKCALHIAIALTMLPGLSRAQSIVRVPNPPPGTQMILRGVRIPANAEIYMLSGLVALPIDPARSEKVEDFGDTQVQTISTLNRIGQALVEQGYSIKDLVKMTIYLAGDPKLGGKLDFNGMNEGFRQFFGTAENPQTVARSTVQVAALTSVKYLVEIDATAAKISK